MNTQIHSYQFLRKYGLREILRKLFRKYIYRKEIQLILEKDLHSGKTKFGRAQKSNIPDHVRSLSYPEDHAAMHRAHPGRAQGFSNWLDQGAKVFGVFVDGELVAMQVAAVGNYREEHFNYTFNLQEDEGLLFAGWLSPDYRRSVITADTLNVCFEYLLKHRVTRAITCVDIDNIKSFKLMLHIEFEETGKQLVIRRLLGFCWTRCVSYQGNKLAHLARPHQRDRKKETGSDKSYST